MKKIKYILLIISFLSVSCERGWIWNVIELNPDITFINTDKDYDVLIELWEGENIDKSPLFSGNLPPNSSKLIKDVRYGDNAVKYTMNNEIVYETIYADQNCTVEISLYNITRAGCCTCD